MRWGIGSLLLSSLASLAACSVSGTEDAPGVMPGPPRLEDPPPTAPVECEDDERRPAGARDFNGDGYDDLIVGAGNGSDSPRAFVQFGNRRGTGGQVLQFSGEEPRARFGWSVAVAGDLNRDGFADFVVGEPSYSGARGNAYVYFGGDAFDTTPEVKLHADEQVQTFGRSVAAAGDLNGDGYDDLVVTAHGERRAWVYFGGAGRTLDPVADLELVGPDGWFGEIAASAGDVNRDGYDDLLIGAPSDGTSVASVFLYLGGETPSTQPYAVIIGRQQEGSFGITLAGLGDINGDGFDDFAVGAPEYKGSTYFYLGGRRKTFAQADVVLDDTVHLQRFGWAVAGVGDVNRDGLADTLVTAPSDYYLGRRTGEAFVIYGSRTFDGSRMATITSARDRFGWSANVVGDFNGDGTSDLSLVSADPQTHASAAHIYFGSAGRPIDPEADLSLTSPLRSLLTVR